MKKRYLNIVVFALFVSMLWGCSDWTKPEAEDFFEMPGNGDALSKKEKELADFMGVVFGLYTHSKIRFYLKV